MSQQKYLHIFLKKGGKGEYVCMINCFFQCKSPRESLWFSVGPLAVGTLGWGTQEKQIL